MLPAPLAPHPQCVAHHTVKSRSVHMNRFYCPSFHSSYQRVGVSSVPGAEIEMGDDVEEEDPISPGTEPKYPTLQADYLPSEPPWKPLVCDGYDQIREGCKSSLPKRCLYTQSQPDSCPQSPKSSSLGSAALSSKLLPNLSLNLHPFLEQVWLHIIPL